jgi:thiamine biosynthesis lipoprotein
VNLNYRFVNIISCSLFALLVAALFCGCFSERKYSRTFFAFNTVIDITLYSSRDPSATLDLLQREIVSLESVLSISNQYSDVWKVNHRHGPIVRVSPITASLARFCEAECDSSGGLFDITVAPLKFLYGLESHQKTRHVPSRTELDSARRFIGCGCVHVLGDSALMLDEGVAVDFGGIGKGYLMSLVKNIFIHAGEQRFLVNLGGDLIAWGDKPGGKPWNVGIQHPRVDSSLIATLSASNTCVFSSGDYERYFIVNGVRYHHIFDPHTATPGRKNQSATVVGADPLLVDVCVKVAFLLDAPRALQYLKQRKLEGVIIDSTGKIWASTGLKNILQPDSKVTVEYR